MTLEARRLKLSQMLRQVLGSNNTYYDPPESIRMKYPAVVYTKSNVDTAHADNLGYLRQAAYRCTYIRKDDDDDLLDKFLDLPYCKYDRPFTLNGLHHDVFTIFV